MVQLVCCDSNRSLASLDRENPGPAVSSPARPRVAAINPITGEIARIYPTLTAVSIDGFQPTMVSKAIKGIYQQSGGYLWKTVETKPDGNTIQDSRVRPLEAVNPMTGEVQERYEGLFAAVKEGYVSAGIRAAIANGWKHHGLVWRYADNQPTTPPRSSSHKAGARRLRAMTPPREER